MFKSLALVVLATVACAATVFPRGSPWSQSGRIIGGKDTDIRDVPYQVSLWVDGAQDCGGSIISKHYVLTAGHCALHGLSAYTIVAGTSDQFSGGSHHSVASIVRHQNYSMNRYSVPSNDVALMRVNDPFEFDETRQPIALFDEAEESVPGTISVITGWGVTDTTADPRVLQRTTVPIITKESCDKAYKRLGGLPEGQICAAYPQGGKDTCKGDSGGPLAINNRLAGIVSWGEDCAVAGKPGVYTEVASYRAWIKANSGI